VTHYTPSLQLIGPHDRFPVKRRREAVMAVVADQFDKAGSTPPWDQMKTTTRDRVVNNAITQLNDTGRALVHTTTTGVQYFVTTADVVEELTTYERRANP